MAGAGGEAVRYTLITGASRGIGRAVALERAKAGDVIIAVGRAQKALESLDDEIRAMGREAVLVPMDIADYGQIATLARIVSETFGRLDSLFCNAAQLGVLGPLAGLGRRTVDEVLTTNLRANVYLIQAFESLLLKGADPRAVFMTSSVATKPRAYWGPYQASKAGLEALAKGWAEEIAHTPIKVNIIDPGGTATQMRAGAKPGEDPSTLPTAQEVAGFIAPWLSPDKDQHGQLVRYADHRATI